MASLINIGMSGLGAAQSGMYTLGNNIANADVESYSRQQNVQKTKGGQQVGVGGCGLGQPEIVGHGSVHGPNVLGDHRHGGPEGVEVVFPVVTAVDKHGAVVNVPIA